MIWALFLRWDNAFATFILFRRKISFSNPELFFHFARCTKDTLKCISMFFLHFQMIFENVEILKIFESVIFLQSATRGANVCKKGNNHDLKNLCWIEGRCVHGTRKRARSYLQPFSDRSQKFPKYPEQYLYKIPLLSSELSSSISNQVFGKFSSMFWYLPWVGSMHKSIMVWRPSTPFENIQPIS